MPECTPFATKTAWKCKLIHEWLRATRRAALVEFDALHARRINRATPVGRALALRLLLLEVLALDATKALLCFVSIVAFRKGAEIGVVELRRLPSPFLRVNSSECRVLLVCALVPAFLVIISASGLLLLSCRRARRVWSMCIRWKRFTLVASLLLRCRVLSEQNKFPQK
jgi:hypothetical protein